LCYGDFATAMPAPNSGLKIGPKSITAQQYVTHFTDIA
jgi:hypothetical protein